MIKINNILIKIIEEVIKIIYELNSILNLNQND